MPRRGIKGAARRAIGRPSRGPPIWLMAGQAFIAGVCCLHKVNYTNAGAADPGPPIARASSKPIACLKPAIQKTALGARAVACDWRKGMLRKSGNRF